MTSRRAAFGIFLSIVGARFARADDTHYQDYLVGGRAVVLGGAFTAIADDPSGIYYNPAGIADERHSSLQVSTSLYGFERSSIDQRLGLPVPGVENLEYKRFTELIVIPASAGFISGFGPKNDNGQHTQAYGVSVMVPSYRSFSTSFTGRLENSTGDAAYLRRVTDRELWSGAGWAIRLGDKLRLGLSGYYILRSVADREDVTVHRPIAGGDTERFDLVTNDVSFTNGNVCLIGGAKYRLLPELSVGLSVQSPSLQAHSNASLAFSRAVSDPDASPPASTFDRLTLTNARSETHYGWVVRAGTAYVRTFKYTLAADVSYHAPVSYTLIDVAPEYRQRLPFNPEVRRRGVMNFNAGGEFLVVREVSIGAGVFSNFSTAPAIPKTPNDDYQPHVNLYGLSMTLGYFGEYTLSRLGVVYSFGHGSDVIPASDIDRVLNDQQGFKRVSYAQSFFYAFLSSTFRY